MMKVSVKQLIAGGALALSAAAALATPVVPPSSYTYDQVGGGSNNGGLFVAAWDEVRGVSIVEYLGVNMDSFLPAVAEAPGYSLEFGTLGNYSATFGASDPSNVHYAVFAIDSSGVGNNGKRVMSTTSNTTFAMTNTATSGTATNIDTFIATALTAATSGGGNGGANPAVANSPSESDYAGNIQWSGLLATPYSAGVGTALNFFLASSTSNNPNGAASIDFYDGLDFAKWLLSSTGVLTYSASAAPVPLPAAVWLLFSGLAGLGVVARRRGA